MTDEQAVQLLQAIREHSGLELSSIRDAANHGADSGFGGFTYYTDTCEFYDHNESLLFEILEEDASEYGYDNIPAFVASFASADSAVNETTYKNLIAWYGLESAGQWLIMRQENRAAA